VLRTVHKRVRRDYTLAADLLPFLLQLVAAGFVRVFRPGFDGLIVRVIADDGTQLGILGAREALALAQEKGLDLVEVSPTARPPVCRIMDYGKFKYEQSKRERKARKKQHVMHLKEVKLRPKVAEHDYDFKVEHARQFLEKRDKVKFTVTFRGREMAHQELGMDVLKRVQEDTAEIAKVEAYPRLEGRQMLMVLAPK